MSYTGFTRISFSSFTDIKNSKEENVALIDNLYINNLKIAYDNTTNTYYYYAPFTDKGKLICLNFNIDNLKFKLTSKFLNFVSIDFNKEYNFMIYSDTEYSEAKLIFTNLPTVQISTLDDIMKLPGIKDVNLLNQDREIQY